MPKSIPKELIERLHVILQSQYNTVFDAFSIVRKGSFRINAIKGDEMEVFEEFAKKGIITEVFDGIKGVYVFDRVHEYAIKGTRAFYDGKIYLQSIASMLPVLVLAPKKDEKILDVCAAPGSKTTQMAVMMENTGKITAIEQNQIRYDKLMHNAHLQGASNIDGNKMDARRYLLNTNEIYDKIILDAPCSAEGRIHIDNEKSFGFWSVANIRDKSNLQSELLSLAYKNLRKGGILVYSTCTLAPEENEGVITDFLRNNVDATLENIDIGLSDRAWWTPGISEFDEQVYDKNISKTVRILPSDETEGFYLAKIQKK